MDVGLRVSGQIKLGDFIQHIFQANGCGYRDSSRRRGRAGIHS